MIRRGLRQIVQPLRQQIAQLSETGAAQQPNASNAFWRGSRYRQLFSSAEGGQGGGGSQASPPKSMLDAGAGWQQSGTGASTLGNAAAARMRAVAAAEQAAEGAGQAAAAGAGAARAGRSILGRIFDWTLYTSLLAVTAGGVVYSRYSIPEVQQMLSDALQQEQLEPSIPNQAWVQLLQGYLSVVVPLDMKVGEQQHCTWGSVSVQCRTACSRSILRVDTDRFSW